MGKPVPRYIDSKPCPVKWCDGNLIVMVAVRIVGEKKAESKPWVQCTEARYCCTYKKYVEKEWLK